MKSSRSLMVLFVALLFAFGFGVARLFQLRFEAGDIYAAYSSLRADPLGAKAFYESLNSLPSLSVRRHHHPLNRLREGGGATLFYLGANANDWNNPPEDLVTDLETLAARGGRLVITFCPETKAPRRGFSEKPKAKKRETPSEPEQAKAPNPMKKRAPVPLKPQPPEDEEDLAERRVRTVSLPQRWGVGLTFRDLSVTERDVFQSVSAVRKLSASLPETISWHTAVHFEGLDPAWRVIYAHGDQPVLIERPWRLGSIVLSADSYFLSNEAMRAERHPDLLAWLIGLSAKVVFDEAHLGIKENPGIVTLARTYRLQGLFVGLLLLAGLFVWKNSFSFVPPGEESPTGATGGWVLGQDSTAGLVQLLRRNISVREILNVCFAEWKKSRASGRTGGDAKLARMQEVLEQEKTSAAKTRDPVGRYQTMSRILTERKYPHESKR